MSYNIIMPQLDKVTYLSQLFWLIIFFSFLFWYISGSVIPTIAKNLKYRKLLLSSFQSKVMLFEKKQSNILNQFDFDFLNLTKKIFEFFKADVSDQEILLNTKLFMKDMSKTLSVIHVFNKVKYSHSIYNLRKGCI